MSLKRLLTIVNERCADFDTDFISSSIISLKIFVQLKMREIKDMAALRIPDFAVFTGQVLFKVSLVNRTGSISLPKENVGASDLFSIKLQLNWGPIK